MYKVVHIIKLTCAYQLYKFENFGINKTVEICYYSNTDLTRKVTTVSVYEHEQGSYKSYRVARSVNGKLRQKYFPRSDDGLAAAKELDKEWANEQAQAQMSFTGMKARWRREPAAAQPQPAENGAGAQSSNKVA